MNNWDNLVWEASFYKRKDFLGKVVHAYNLNYSGRGDGKRMSGADSGKVPYPVRKTKGKQKD
jgi:hypothetical protein